MFRRSAKAQAIQLVEAIHAERPTEDDTYRSISEFSLLLDRETARELERELTALATRYLAKGREHVGQPGWETYSYYQILQPLPPQPEDPAQ